jgi:hypothetical protein
MYVQKRGAGLTAEEHTLLKVCIAEAHWFGGLLYCNQGVDDPARHEGAVKALAFLVEVAPILDDDDAAVATAFRARCQKDKAGVMSFKFFPQFLLRMTKAMKGGAASGDDPHGNCDRIYHILENIREHRAAGDGAHDGGIDGWARPDAPAASGVEAKVAKAAKSPGGARGAAGEAKEAKEAKEVKDGFEEEKEGKEAKETSNAGRRRSRKNLNKSDYDEEDDVHSEYEDELAQHHAKLESVIPGEQLTQVDVHLKNGRELFKTAMKHASENDHEKGKATSIEAKLKLLAATATMKSALKHHDENLSLESKLRYKRRLVEAYRNLGIIYNEMTLKKKVAVGYLRDGALLAKEISTDPLLDEVLKAGKKTMKANKKAQKKAEKAYMANADDAALKAAFDEATAEYKAVKNEGTYNPLEAETKVLVYLTGMTKGAYSPVYSMPFEEVVVHARRLQELVPEVRGGGGDKGGRNEGMKG